MQWTFPIKLAKSQQPKAVECWNWYQMFATIIFYTQLIHKVHKRTLSPSEYQ